MTSRNLTDVPEEGLNPSPTSPYTMSPSSANASTSTFTLQAPTSVPATRDSSTSKSRKPASVRTLGEKPSRDGFSSSIRRHASTSSLHSFAATKDAKRTADRERERERDQRSRGGNNGGQPGNPIVPAATLATPTVTQKIRTTPRLPHDKDALPAPATMMYWSRAPVYGAVPMRSMRAHSVTLVDTVAWLFGGCDDKDCWKDIYCFDTETMQWSHPDTQGDVPPPCRAHTATLVDRKIIIFGGGQGPTYYNTIFVLDTITRKWAAPTPTGPHPTPRRAHTAVFYQNKIWVFGGGNGLTALNDVWTLDVGGSIERMRWTELETHGVRPSPRGYHTTNLVGNIMVVVGGSDGKECFSDIWLLNLDSLVWTQVTLHESHRRLSHSATQVGSYLFIMGGHDGSDYTSELLLFNLVSLQFEHRKTYGRGPGPRGYHVSLLADSRLFVCGGYNGHTVYDDVYLLDLAAAAYLPQVTSFAIEVPA